MVLDHILGMAACIGLFGLFVFRISGGELDIEKVVIPAALFVFAGSWLLDVIKLIRHPPAIAEIPHLWGLALQTFLVIFLSYHEIRDRCLRHRKTIS